MNKIKRFSSVVLCVVMLVSMLAVSQFSFAFAATDGDYEYIVVDDTSATVTDYLGSDKNITVPANLGGYPVTAVASEAFKGAGLISVVLPEGITAIGDAAFQDNAALISISLPNSLSTVGDGAFIDCTALTEITFDSNVTAIGLGALSGCDSLASLTVPFIGTSATGDDSIGMLFDGSAAADAGYPDTLKTVRITADTTVNTNAFKGMNKVETITFDKKIASLKANAFYGCAALKVLDADLVQISEIGANAFYGCKALTEIEIKNVTTLGDGAFKGCSALATITINSAKLKSVGKDAVAGTAWLAAQDGNYAILGKVFVAFKGDETEALAIDFSYDNPAFDDSQEESETNPAYLYYDVTAIADSALEGVSSLLVSFPKSVNYIGKNVLKDAAVVMLEIPFLGNSPADKDTPFISYLFGGSSVAENATLLPEDLMLVSLSGGTAIPSKAFQGCKYLQAVRIPETVTEVRSLAFAGCPELYVVQYDAVNATVASDAFDGCDALSEVYFGEKVNVIPTYLCTANANITEVFIPDEVTKIDTRAFAGCYNLEDVYFAADNCTSVATDAFDYCHKLSSIELEYYEDEELGTVEGVEYIPANLYSRYGGSGLTEIYIPATVKEIAAGAFANCTALTTLYFDAADCKIGADAFSACTSLKDIVLGEKVTTIPANLFAGNPSFTKVEIPAHITHIDDYAFQGCTNLAEVIIGENLNSIGENILAASKWYDVQEEGPLYLGTIFYGYKGTVADPNGAVTLLNGTTAIGAGAFKGNGSVQNVFIPNSVKFIGENAFAASAAEITCYEDATYVISYAQANGIKVTTLTCPETTVYFEKVSDGKYNKVCLDCGQILETVEADESALVGQWVVTTPATCTTTGIITKSGTTETQVLPVKGHFASVWKVTKEASCAEEGKKQEFCTECEAELDGTIVLQKLPHVAGTWETLRPARVFCTGLQAVLCVNCDTVLKTRELDKLVADENVMESITDVISSEWYYETVRFALQNQLFSGIEQDLGGRVTLFAPNNNMTRGMFVTVLGRLYGVKTEDYSGKTKFSDVKASKYYAPYVKWASANGIVNGKTKTTFAPDVDITREEICAVMVRYCDYADIKLNDAYDSSHLIFRDADRISTYALEAVLTCHQSKLVQGRGDRIFAPKETATRAEVAQVLRNFAENYLAN